MAAFATFAVGFFARPLGGIVFGHFGDRLGRKSMLVITLMMMGVADVPHRPAADIRARSGVLAADAAGRSCASCRASASAASGAARC